MLLELTVRIARLDEMMNM